MAPAAEFDHSRRARTGLRFGASRARGDDGAAVIELALILPILAVLVFGTIDLGRGYSDKNELTNMAREGGFAAIRGNCAGAVAAAQSENPAMAAKASTIKLVSGTSTSGAAITSCASGSTVTMVVQRKMALVTPLIGAILNGSSVTLTGTSTVRVP